MDGWACTNCLNMIITLQFYIDLLYFRLNIHIVDIKSILGCEIYFAGVAWKSRNPPMSTPGL